MFRRRFQDLARSVEETHYSSERGGLSEEEAFEGICDLLSQVQREKGVVYVIGNGGSAGIASHFSCDLIKTLKIPSLTFYDSNLMTCLGNDLGYENVFRYPLSQLLKPQDLLVAISSSGKSPNIVLAAELCASRQIPLITLSGFSPENPLRKLGRINLWVDRADYGLVETSHFFLLHTIVDLWDKKSLLKKEYAEAHTS